MTPNPTMFVAVTQLERADRTLVSHVGEAIYRACHSEWRGYIPRSIELRYERMARAALRAVIEQTGRP